MRRTLSNLYKLVAVNILTANSVALYMFCKLNEGKLTVNTIHKSINLSTTIIRHHLHIMNELGIIAWSAQRGKAGEIICSDLDDEATERILGDSSLLSSLSNYKDLKINKYNTKGYEYNILKGGGSDELQVLKELIPAEHLNFRVTPAHLHKLKQLAGDVDLADYCKYFVKHKLGKTVTSFGIGIFVYEGIVREYKLQTRKKQKANAYKKVSSRKASFDQAAKEFEEDIRAEL